MSVVKNCVCGIEYDWYFKHQHFKDVFHETIKCDCGSEFSLEQKHRHLISAKHLNFLGQEPIKITCECGIFYKIW